MNLRIVEHKDVSESEIINICSIKSAFGSYSLESQKAWIKARLGDDDLHFLLYENRILIGYLNLMDITLTINDKELSGYGIGNVCTKIQGVGCGQILMKHVNQFLLSRGKIGYLFCKNSLTSFYKKSGWVTIECRGCNIPGSVGIESMFYNYIETIIQFEYNGELF